MRLLKNLKALRNNFNNPQSLFCCPSKRWGRLKNMEKKEDELWRVAYNNHERGTAMNFKGEPVRVLDFKVLEDRKFYEDWENADQMKYCSADEELVRGYWTHEGYHRSYCRKRRR